jgi:hypothetical protein
VIQFAENGFLLLAFYFSSSNSSIQLKKDENSPPFDFSAPSISLLMTGK